eukprot:gene12952-8808_t
MFSLKDRGLGLITSELLFRVIMAATHQITAQQPRIREEAKGKLSSSGSDELFVVNLSHHARSTHAQPPADPVRNASALVLGSKARGSASDILNGFYGKVAHVTAALDKRFPALCVIMSAPPHRLSRTPHPTPTQSTQRSRSSAVTMFSLKDRGLGLITSELLFRVIMAATHQITAQQPRIREEAKGKLSSSGSDELFVVNLSHHARSTHAQPPADPVRRQVMSSERSVERCHNHHQRGTGAGARSTPGTRASYPNHLLPTHLAA